MAKTILSETQTRILEEISREDQLCRFFYLTGGTALAEFYLKHRDSEDLDFFSEDEFEAQAVSVFFQKHKKGLGIKKVDFQQSFNRNLFFLRFGCEIVKTEFTYFPFPRIEKKMKIGALNVDSLLDIAVNKVFTIYQNPRSRDFIDLYLIIKKTGWKLGDLIKKAQLKFETYIDPLQLGSKFLLADELKDYPVMIKPLENREWQKFFRDEAMKLDKKILKHS